MQDMYDRKRRMFACWLSSGRNGFPANQASIWSSKLSVRASQLASTQPAAFAWSKLRRASTRMRWMVLNWLVDGSSGTAEACRSRVVSTFGVAHFRGTSSPGAELSRLPHFVVNCYIRFLDVST